MNTQRLLDCDVLTIIAIVDIVVDDINNDNKTKKKLNKSEIIEFIKKENMSGNTILQNKKTTLAKLFDKHNIMKRAPAIKLLGKVHNFDFDRLRARKQSKSDHLVTTQPLKPKNIVSFAMDIGQKTLTDNDHEDEFTENKQASFDVLEKSDIYDDKIEGKYLNINDMINEWNDDIMSVDNNGLNHDSNDFKSCPSVKRMKFICNYYMNWVYFHSKYGNPTMDSNNDQNEKRFEIDTMNIKDTEQFIIEIVLKCTKKTNNLFFNKMLNCNENYTIIVKHIITSKQSIKEWIVRLDHFDKPILINYFVNKIYENRMKIKAMANKTDICLYISRCFINDIIDGINDSQINGQKLTQILINDNEQQFKKLINKNNCISNQVTHNIFQEIKQIHKVSLV